MRYLLILFSLVIGSSLALASENAVVVNRGLEHTSNSNYGDGWTGSARYEHRFLGNLWLGPEYTYHGRMLHHTAH